MKRDYIYISIIILIMFKGNLFNSSKEIDNIKIDSVKVIKSTPIKVGEFKNETPKPIPAKRYANPNIHLKNTIKELEYKYKQKADSVAILRELLQVRQIRKYSEVFEDSIIKATINTETLGYLKSIDFKYVAKPQKVVYFEKEITKTLTPKFSLLIGAKITSSNNINNSSLEFNLGAQIKKGNVIEIGYNTSNQISIGYKLNAFSKY